MQYRPRIKIFADENYPFVVSTKGTIIADKEYLDLIKSCNCVVQISMVCNKYDVLEKGCPSFVERLKILESVSKVARRTIVRVQPYMRGAWPHGPSRGAEPAQATSR